MGHAHGCGCFPTGQVYPGIATLQGVGPAPVIGLANDLEPDKLLAHCSLAVIDTETTGKDPARGDRVIEIAVVCFDDGVVTKRHSALIDPGIPIPAELTLVHGISDADVKGQPKFDLAMAKTISGWLAGRVPVAYNASFDRAFIYAEMRRAGIAPSTQLSLPPALRTNVEWIDPLVWSRISQPEVRGHKLVDVTARLGIELERAHRATDDAEATGHVLLSLLKSLGNPSYRAAIRQQKDAVAGWGNRFGGGRR
jgi:DNA polymerase-3 subunit epsilon